MKKFILGLIALFAFACGSYNDGVIGDGTADDDSSEIELGQSEQAINVGNGGYGFTNATAQLRCAQPGVSGQVCFSALVATKTVGYCFSGFTTAQQNRIKAGFTAVDGQTNWTFLNVGFPCDISIQNGTVGGGTTNIENFAKMTPTGTLGALTSPAGASHINGSWTSFNKLSVVVDQLKLDGFGGTLPTTYSRYVGGAIAARYMGLGSQSLSDSASLASFTHRSMPANTGSLLTSGEVCRVNGLSGGTFGQISNTFGCGI